MALTSNRRVAKCGNLFHVWEDNARFYYYDENVISQSHARALFEYKSIFLSE